jgi:hypothetical protein
MSAVLHLRVGSGTIQAQLTRRSRTLWTGTASFEGPADLGEAIAQLAVEESLPQRPTGLRVELQPPLAQVRTLAGLPPIRTAALRSLVANQSGRFFRRNGEPLVTDAVWVRRSKGAATVARAAAAEEPWVDAIVRGARAGALSLDAIVPSATSADEGFQLISPAERSRQTRLELLALRRLGLLAAGLWLLAAFAVGLGWERERRHLDRELAAVAAPLRAVLTARRAAGSAAQMVETIEQQQGERTAIVRQVAMIAEAMPDSAYLTFLSLDGKGMGEMTGMAPRATSVVSALERRAAAVGPKLIGSAVREPMGGEELESFRVAFGPGGAP